MDDIRLVLEAIGTLPDDEVDLADAALQLARIDAPDADWRAARAHLSELARCAVARVEQAGPRADSIAVLRDVMVGEFGYGGDAETYDDPANANLLRVIERRRGMPVSLAILWIHASSAAGWPAHGVDVPGHLVVGIGELPPLRRVVDVFAGGKELTEAGVKPMARRAFGPRYQIDARRFWPMSNRGMLVRLQANIEQRRTLTGDDAGALTCIEDTLRVAPLTRWMWRKAGALQRQLGLPRAALISYETFIALGAPGEDLADVAGIVAQLRAQLH